MARAYTVGTVALALDVPSKWLDNILSHHRVPGVVQARQGVSRKVTPEGLLQLALAVRLIGDLGIPAANALQLAGTIAASNGIYSTPSGIGVSLDLNQLRSKLETRLAQAVEIAPVPRRGRPAR
jgi:hypothetical protein